MIRFLRWFKGYLRLEIKGQQFHRFLNLCTKLGIHIWNINEGPIRRLNICISIRDFWKLRPIAKSTKTKIRIAKKKGFPIWCSKHPLLKWSPIFLLLLTSGFLYSRTFLWTITIEGNQKIDNQHIIDILNEENIVKWTKEDQIDCTYLEKRIRKEIATISWISVSYDSTNLRIQIKESSYPDIIQDENGEMPEYNHISAKWDGTIISIVVLKGTALVDVGDQVRKGQILVKGEYYVYDDAGNIKETPLVKGEAKIQAQVEHSVILPVTEMEIVAMKIVGTYENKGLLDLANLKLDQIISFFRENGVIIVEKNVIIDKMDRSILIYYHFVTEEEIGMPISLEEDTVYEFE